jgi:hypothetical protein
MKTTLFILLQADRNLDALKESRLKGAMFQVGLLVVIALIIVVKIITAIFKKKK